MFAGLRASHGADALAFAVMEGVAFSFADGVDVLDAAGARPVRPLLVGGGSRSDFWGQMIADVTGLTIDVAQGAEAGAALGAARLGMLAAGAGTVEAVCARPPVQQELCARRRQRRPARAAPPALPGALSGGEGGAVTRPRSGGRRPPGKARASGESGYTARHSTTRSPTAVTRICTPMHISRNADSRTTTWRAVAPIIAVRRSAKR